MSEASTPSSSVELVKVVVAFDEARVKRVELVAVPVSLIVDVDVSSPPLWTSMCPDQRAFWPLLTRDEVAKLVALMVVVEVVATSRVPLMSTVRPLLVEAAVGLMVKAPVVEAALEPKA